MSFNLSMYGHVATESLAEAKAVEEEVIAKAKELFHSLEHAQGGSITTQHSGSHTLTKGASVVSESQEGGSTESTDDPAPDSTTDNPSSGNE